MMASTRVRGKNEKMTGFMGYSFFLWDDASNSSPRRPQVMPQNLAIRPAGTPRA